MYVKTNMHLWYKYKKLDRAREAKDTVDNLNKMGHHTDVYPWSIIKAKIQIYNNNADWTQAVWMILM